MYTYINFIFYSYIISHWFPLKAILKPQRSAEKIWPLPAHLNGIRGSASSDGRVCLKMEKWFSFPLKSMKYTIQMLADAYINHY